MRDSLNTTIVTQNAWEACPWRSRLQEPEALQFQSVPTYVETLSGAFQLMAEMHRQGILGSVVTLICDPGELYRGISIRMATMRDCSTTVMRFKLYLDHLEQFTLRVM